jgi:hypothetical protein
MQQSGMVVHFGSLLLVQGGRNGQIGQCIQCQTRHIIIGRSQQVGKFGNGIVDIFVNAISQEGRGESQQDL